MRGIIIAIATLVVSSELAWAKNSMDRSPRPVDPGADLSFEIGGGGIDFRLDVGGGSGRYGDFRGHRPPGHGGGDMRTRYICYAQNRRGRFFSAQGRDPYFTQQRAMQNCWDRSRLCVERGCDRIGRMH